MKDATRAIEQILEARFGRTEAQALAFGRARLVRKDIQFMDLKHMAELGERYRQQVRRAIHDYRAWRAMRDAETDPLLRLYTGAEEAMLHRRIGDGLKLWYFAHRDYHAMRREYLMKCMAPQSRVDWTNAA